MTAATDALLAGDTELRELTERTCLVDQLEAELEELTERELLTQTPMAGDMRFLVSVLRVVPELERSGDLAEHIAQRAAAGLALRLTPMVRGLLEQMGGICSNMWRRAADAWVERDAGTRTWTRPTTSSTCCRSASTSELESADISLPDALQTTLLARFYERLGDHAVHISERIRYLAVGT